MMAKFNVLIEVEADEVRRGTDFLELRTNGVVLAIWALPKALQPLTIKVTELEIVSA